MSVNYFYLKSIIAFSAFVLCLAACEETVEFVNVPPSKLSITKGKCYIWTAGEMTLTGSAEDDDGDPLTFTWSATAGTFTPPNGVGEEVTWRAPDTPGSVIMTLKVSDGIDERTLSVAIDVGEAFPSPIFGNVEFEDRGYPYIITDDQPVVVSASSNLTLGPGVILIVDSEFGGLDVRGGFTVNGQADDKVTIGPNSCVGVTHSWGGIYITGESANATIKNMNINAGADGIQALDGATVTIDSCTITDHDEAGLSVIDGSSATVTNCKIWDNGTGIYVMNADFSLLDSSLRYNDGRGVSVTVITDEPTTYDMAIEGCVLANNGVDGIFLIGEASPRIHQCSIFFNGPETGVGYALRLGNYTETDSVRADNNYWGTTEEQEVREMIFDRHDDAERVKAYVGYLPILTTEP